MVNEEICLGLRGVQMQSTRPPALQRGKTIIISITAAHKHGIMSPSRSMMIIQGLITSNEYVAVRETHGSEAN